MTSTVISSRGHPISPYLALYHAQGARPLPRLRERSRRARLDSRHARHPRRRLDQGGRRALAARRRRLRLQRLHARRATSTRPTP